MKFFAAAILGFGPLFSAAEKYTFKSSGRGGRASAFGDSCNEWPFGSYVDVYASQDTTKTKGNGQPGSQVFPYMSAYYSLWSDCTAESATLIEPNYDLFYEQVVPATLSFPGNNKLQTGTASGSFPAWEVPCQLVAESNDYGEWTTYDCNYSLATPTTVDVQASWTGTGSSYQDRYTSSNRFNGGMTKSTTKGISRDASVAIAITAEGAAYSMDYSYGSLFKSTSTSMEKYQF